MSFGLVIYTTLGMSGCWEIHEKIVKTSEICRVFPGRALGVDLGSIPRRLWDHLGSIWVAKIGKRRSRNLNEK